MGAKTLQVFWRFRSNPTFLQQRSLQGYMHVSESCCSLRFLTRTRWKTSSAAPCGRLFLEKHGSIWGTSCQTMPFNSRRPQVNLTAFDTSQCVQCICSRVQWQLHKRPQTCAARVSLTDAAPALCLTALHRHIFSKFSKQPQIVFTSNRVTGKQDQACPRRGAAFNCSNKTVSLQNQ